MVHISKKALTVVGVVAVSLVVSTAHADDAALPVIDNGLEAGVTSVLNTEDEEAVEYESEYEGEEEDEEEEVEEEEEDEEEEEEKEEEKEEDKDGESRRLRGITGPALPDLKSGTPFLRIGQVPKQAIFGSHLKLEASDAFLIDNNQAAFNIYYSERNAGSAKASGFSNQITLNGNVVSVQGPRQAEANTVNLVHTQAYFPIVKDTRRVCLQFDALKTVVESNEANNLECFTVAFQKSFFLADLTPIKQVVIGNKTVDLGSVVVLEPSDSFLQEGDFAAFNIKYIEKNKGAKDAVDYENSIFHSGGLVSKQNHRTLTAGAETLVHTQAYLNTKLNKRSLVISLDSGAIVNESDEANNSRSIRVIFKGF